mmetsp:Transcript_13541/g.18584  ORF Transcript_13541/g.18584 Transcript_13541/m.18584 type:complete len:84 (+) Transcript_13541:140-391(+)
MRTGGSDPTFPLLIEAVLVTVIITFGAASGAKTMSTPAVRALVGLDMLPVVPVADVADVVVVEATEEGALSTVSALGRQGGST